MFSTVQSQAATLPAACDRYIEAKTAQYHISVGADFAGSLGDSFITVNINCQAGPRFVAGTEDVTPMDFCGPRVACKVSTFDNPPDVWLPAGGGDCTLEGARNYVMGRISYSGIDGNLYSFEWVGTTLYASKGIYR